MEIDFAHRCANCVSKKRRVSANKVECSLTGLVMNENMVCEEWRYTFDRRIKAREANLMKELYKRAKEKGLTD